MVAVAPERSDAELVEAVRAGDTKAFSELYRAHLGSVRAVAASQVRDADAVGDIVQDTFVRALRSLGGLNDPARFRPWLLSIARHLATDYLRARSRVVLVDDEMVEARADTGRGPGSLAELRELAEQVQGCVAGLSRRDATAVAMVTHLGFTPEQVASALGLSPGAAKVVVHRARRRLRHALVLQVLVRQPDLACPELQALLENDPLGAAKHVETCQTCVDSAGNEVMAFELTRTEDVPGPEPTATGPAAPEHP
jgi:RNA polymerase sigma factor (sigma-70 family)